jgi:hypothetical protein
MRETILVDFAALHDHDKVLGGIFDQLDVVERIAVDQQEIGERALLHDAELAGVRVSRA